MNTAEHWLIILLRISGIGAGMAIFAVFMPHAWMDAGHRAMHMGPLPQEPIVEYLARSVSALYALLGGFWWVAAGDLPRYRRLLAYSLIAGLIGGPLLLVMDIQLGLPTMWVASEGPIVFGHSLVLLLLMGAARKGITLKSSQT